MLYNYTKKPQNNRFKSFIFILLNYLISGTFRGRKIIDTEDLLGMLWDSPAHHFHVPCQHSQGEVDSQRVSFEKKSSYEIMELNGNHAAGYATGSFQAKVKKKKKTTTGDFKALSGEGPRN